LSRGSVSVVISPDGSTITVVVDRERRSLPIFSLALRELVQLSPNEASALLGARVIAALGHAGLNEFIQVGYSALRSERDALLVQSEMKAIDENDAEALFGIALDKIVESMIELSPDLLEEAETYIQKAANLGLARAQEFMEGVWAYEKAERLQAIRDARARPPRKGPPI
jgi:hypothetical protein